MVKTGDNIFHALSLVAILLPLVPFAVIFLRHVYHFPVMNFLRLFCFFTFIQHAILTFPELTQSATPFVTAAFRLAEFAFLFYLLRITITSSRLRYMMNLLLVSFISVIVTIKVLKGVDAYPKPIAFVQAFIILGMTIIVLLQLVRNKQIILFESPIFWVAAGTFCYVGMYLFMNLVLARQTSISQETELEKNMVLSVVDMMRFIFYTIAAYVTYDNKSYKS